MLSNEDIARVVEAAVGQLGGSTAWQDLVEVVHEVREPSGDVDMMGPFRNATEHDVGVAVIETMLAIDAGQAADLDGPLTEVRNGALAYAIQWCHAHKDDAFGPGDVTRVAGEFEGYLLGRAAE